MITCIICDIEGTTTSVRFVHEVLFPYSYERLADFVAAKIGQPGVRACLRETQQTIWEESGIESTYDQTIEALLSWIKSDRKHSALKRIQGMIWREGYEQGLLKGHVYPDVPPKLRQWRERGLDLGVYSSGSIEAQRLLFRYSDQGDLSSSFSHHFDTDVGHKREMSSYRRIANLLQLPAAQILFLSDVEEELDAARSAGMATVQLVREGTKAGERHPVAADFSAIQI